VTVPVGSPEAPADLAGALFVALRSELFDEGGRPSPFPLRDKRQTQDDPFDEHIGEILQRRLPRGMKVFLSGKPLVSPDLVVARPEETSLLIRGGQDWDPRHVIAVEVKKLNADVVTGRSGRSTGLDYNSTPPCATVKVESQRGALLRVPAFYLYVALAAGAEGFTTPALALVAGAALNEDVDLYDAATGIRQKAIGLGTYGDGLDRQRPMFVFANPLGWSWLDGHATLIHAREDLAEEQDLVMRRPMIRTAANGGRRAFFCYRAGSEGDRQEADALNPFPTPANRKAETTARGRFRIAL